MGATVAGGRVTFRVWAPNAVRVQIELYLPGGTEQHELLPEPGADPAITGMFVAELPGVTAGTRYRYRLDGGDPLPDPCSRSQPEGVHGPSAVVDPGAFAWTDGGWKGLRPEGLAIYELHVGAFTPAGTFQAAITRLDYLRDLGVNAIELMPVAGFPGRWNWGYDGVALYAPSSTYGGPEGLRLLVNAAHQRGLGVLLDVVYNHLGPDGNYLRAFSPYYFTHGYQTPWGEAINYDGEQSGPVREYVLQNAEHWISEYHIDGLRLDATHAIYDGSEPHLLRALADRTRAAAGTRSIVLIAENDANDVQLVTPAEQGGYGLDAVWADDFHHAVHATLTGEQEGYYQDYAGGAAEIARAVRDGFLYQGQPSRHLGRERGTTVTDEPASTFVFCLQNHDQTGNRALGERLHHLAPPDLFRVATAVLLFAPETPLLFMGQEFGATSPFQYFTDHEAALGRLVTEGRRSEFGHFSAFRDQKLRSRIPDPQNEATFFRSKLDWREADTHAGILTLYRDLLQLRRSDPVLGRHDRAETAAVAINTHALAVLQRAGDEQRLLLANFGPLTPLSSLDQGPGEPAVDSAGPDAELLRMLRSDAQTQWRVELSTADPRYGLPGEDSTAGRSAGAAVSLNGIEVPAHTALILGRLRPPYIQRGHRRHSNDALSFVPEPGWAGTLARR